MNNNTAPIEISQVWKDTLELLRKNNSSYNFNSWLKELTLEELTEETALILAADEFKAVWVTENYQGGLVDALANTLGRSVEVTVTHLETQNQEHQATQIMLPNIHPKACMAPNTLIKSALFGIVGRRKRQAVEDRVVHSWKGSSIRYTGIELGQGELDVWMQILRLMRNQELGKPVYFTKRGFLKALGRHTGKYQYDRLHKELNRLTANALEVKQGPYAYVGSLVDEYYKNDETGRFAVVANPKLVGLFDLGFTRVQWEERLSLKSELSKSIHIYIHANVATPERPHRIGLEKLQKLTRSATKAERKFRQQIRQTMQEMKALGVVESWQIFKNPTTEKYSLEFVRPYPLTK